MEFIIRAERASDAEAVEAVTVAAFERAPHADGTEHLIVRALRRAEALTVSLVAERDGAVLGHAAISPVTISSGTAGWFGLGPVSVAPAHQRRGIGSQLVREALQRFRERGAAGCVVLGDPAYYARFGFRADSALLLPDVPPQYFQVLPFGAAVPRGTVSYHSAFAVSRAEE